MKYMKRPLNEFRDYGYTAIHLFGDYYLLRAFPKPTVRFSYYVLAKIRKD